MCKPEPPPTNGVRLLRSNARVLSRLLVDPGLEIGARRLHGARQAKLRRDALDPVRRVDVLDEHNLEARGRALARRNRRVGKEELPNLG
jgi:hypothetical protein